MGLIIRKDSDSLAGGGYLPSPCGDELGVGVGSFSTDRAQEAFRREGPSDLEFSQTSYAFRD